MRELKVRAWSIKRSKFLNIDSLYCADGKVCAIVDDGVVYDIEDVILEQYTGLKDKNGKEIYEGDILQIDDHILGDFEVVWHNLGWAIKRAVGYETLSVHKPNDITVIGNIHESPKMLEEEE